MPYRQWISPLVLATLLLTNACTQPAAVSTPEAIENAVDDHINIVDANDDRADHLDEKAAELLDQANASTGSAADALRNEASADVATAASIQQQGETAGEKAGTGMR